DRSGNDADQDGLAALLFRQAGGGEADDDRIIARQHQVNHNDLKKCGKHFGCEIFAHLSPVCNSKGQRRTTGNDIMLAASSARGVQLTRSHDCETMDELSILTLSPSSQFCRIAKGGRPEAVISKSVSAEILVRCYRLATFALRGLQP